ncbi:MAG: TonB-dependent receptor [Calditrichaeota bacterium]|nr:MAG: TonB-dependent receptor [Calditrichota bacterium]
MSGNQRLTFLLLLLIFSSSIFAQKFTISGYVQDNASGEKLIGANVFIKDQNRGTATNNYGFFSLTLPESETDSLTLLGSYIGYRLWQKTLPANSNQQIEIALQLSVLQGETVEVIAEALEPIESKSQMSVIEVPIDQLQHIPALLGEIDVIKAMQLLPGVQSGSEGSSGLYVRGGAPDQNLILLDGAPVYNASHLFGFFSIFNADAVKNVKLTKGGFPARFGGRLSSVMEINLKEGNNQEIDGQFTLGIISSRFNIEGPIKKGKSSFIFSGRRTYIDWLAQPFLKESERGNGYYFGDLNAKFNYILSDKNRLFLSLYSGLDKAYVQNEDKWETAENKLENDLWWGNLTSTLRWNWLISQKLFSNSTFMYSKYRFNVELSDEEKNLDQNTSEAYYLKYHSGIEDWTAAIDFDFLPDPAHDIKFGGTVVGHTFRPGAVHFKSEGNNVFEIDTLIAPVNTQKAIETSFYLEDDFDLTPLLKINAGLHASSFSVNSKLYSSVQPRFSMRYLFGSWALKSSFATMTQYVHLLTNSGIGLPTDLWVPTTPKVKPQKSQQYALGLAHTFADKKLEASLEGYYKKMENLVSYKEGANFVGLDELWEDKITAGKGESYGIELFLQRKQGKTTGWLGYTLSWSNRQFEELNFGNEFPYRYDRRHDLSLVVNHKIRSGIELSGTWVFGTGNSISLPSATYTGFVDYSEFLGEYFGEIKYYSERNGSRMRAYHRLDLSIRFVKGSTERKHVWAFGVYNAYNRKNPFFYFFSEEENSTPVVKQASLFPIIPAISYSYSF